MAMQCIEYGGRPIAPRPALYGPEVAAEVFDDIKHDLIDKIESYTHDHIEKCKKNFVDAATSAGHDGYEVARYLERFCSWRCNAQMVDVIDNAPWEKHYRFFVQQWLDYWKIEPLFKVGDKVVFSHLGSLTETTVVSTASSHEPGTYLLAGLDTDSHCRPIVRWEDCKAATE